MIEVFKIIVTFLVGFISGVILMDNALDFFKNRTKEKFIILIIILIIMIVVYEGMLHIIWKT
jgi:undecaprenyl pyrophosphate phosphatase UppP